MNVGKIGNDESVGYFDYSAPIAATRVVGIVAEKMDSPENEKPVKFAAKDRDQGVDPAWLP